jgi:hypothetical protein
VSQDKSPLSARPTKPLSARGSQISRNRGPTEGNLDFAPIRLVTGKLFEDDASVAP